MLLLTRCACGPEPWVILSKPHVGYSPAQRAVKGRVRGLCVSSRRMIGSCQWYPDPEDNVGEVYYKMGYIVRQGFSRPIDFQKQSDEEILACSKSFEATEGPFQDAKLPVG